MPAGHNAAHQRRLLSLQRLRRRLRRRADVPGRQCERLHAVRCRLLLSRRRGRRRLDSVHGVQRGLHNGRKWRRRRGQHGRGLHALRRGLRRRARRHDHADRLRALRRGLLCLSRRRVHVHDVPDRDLHSWLPDRQLVSFGLLDLCPWICRHRDEPRHDGGRRLLSVRGRVLRRRRLGRLQSVLRGWHNDSLRRRRQRRGLRVRCGLLPRNELLRGLPCGLVLRRAQRHERLNVPVLPARDVCVAGRRDKLPFVHFLPAWLKGR